MPLTKVTANMLADDAVETAKIKDANVTQSKLAAGVAGNGPAFRATLSANQTGIANDTVTKVQFNTETFDTASCYDNATNYRFTPNVAGYYQLNFIVRMVGTSSRQYAYIPRIQKNGTTINSHEFDITYGASSDTTTLTLATLVYLNGTTDYVEAYAYHYDRTSAGTTLVAYTGSEFSGFLARAA